MQIVGVLLTKHVLANYAKFVHGIEDVTTLQAELCRTYEGVKAARASLGAAAADITASTRLGRELRTRLSAGDTFCIVEQLQQTHDLQSSLTYCLNWPHSLRALRLLDLPLHAHSQFWLLSRV